jgi:hypothetical protein
VSLFEKGTQFLGEVRGGGGGEGGVLWSWCKEASLFAFRTAIGSITGLSIAWNLIKRECEYIYKN